MAMVTWMLILDAYSLSCEWINIITKGISLNRAVPNEQRI